MAFEVGEYDNLEDFVDKMSGLREIKNELERWPGKNLISNKIIDFIGIDKFLEVAGSEI